MSVERPEGVVIDDAHLRKADFVEWRLGGHTRRRRHLFGYGMATTTIYFAYGSNMAADVMLRICPSGRRMGVGYVPNHRLAFTRKSVRTGSGVADIAPARNGEVWGVLYELSDFDLAALDRKEGNGWAYVRTAVVVRRIPKLDEIRAVTYTVLHKEDQEIRPSDTYIAGLVRGAEEAGLPAAYVATLRTVVQDDAETSEG